MTFNSITCQGPTVAGENGVQISDGAAGCVTDNAIVDNVWAPDVFRENGDAAAGILVYGSEHILVQNNIFRTTLFGIATVTDPVYGSAAASS